jgi:integral membrane protein (TIGR00529 family)
MFHALVSLPASVKIGSVFLLILVFYRLGLPLSFSILLNAFLLGLWSGGGLQAVLFQVKTILGPECLLLALAIVLLLYFTGSLTSSGLMEKTINALKASFHRPRLLFAGFPALIGLLPMPGGAIFSAPMVDTLDKEKKLPPALRTAVNYWFRHVWEFWWPLYPGVILALKYSGLPIAVFICIQAPLTLFALAGGAIFILNRVKSSRPLGPRSKLEVRSALAALVPIAILVVAAVGGSYLLPRFGVRGTMASLVAMLAGLAIALAVVLVPSRRTFGESLKIFTKPTIWSFVVLVLGVHAFSAALKRPLGPDEITLVGQMRDEFFRMGIPLLAVMMAIPFVSGMVTGVAMGFVGASFPLVFGLLGADPGLGHVLGLTTLAYGFGYLGMMLSPVHICFVVTNEYFKSRMLDAYRLILGPAAVVAAGVLGLSAFYYFIF